MQGESPWADPADKFWAALDALQSQGPEPQGPGLRNLLCFGTRRGHREGAARHPRRSNRGALYAFAPGAVAGRHATDVVRTRLFTGRCGFAWASSPALWLTIRSSKFSTSPSGLIAGALVGWGVYAIKRRFDPLAPRAPQAPPPLPPRIIGQAPPPLPGRRT